MHMGHGHCSWVVVVGGCGLMMAVVTEGGGGRSFMGGWHWCACVRLGVGVLLYGGRWASSVGVPLSLSIY